MIDNYKNREVRWEDENGIVRILKPREDGYEWMDENGDVHTLKSYKYDHMTGWMDEKGDFYVDGCKIDLDALEEIRKRGTIKGSDYNPYEEIRARRRSKYSENGWF